MGGLRRKLRFASHRSIHRTVSSLAADPPGGLLPGRSFSPFECADLSARHLSLARHRGDDSFSLTELAAPGFFYFSTEECIASQGDGQIASARKTNPDPKFRDTLRRDPNSSSTASLPLLRRHRMDLHGTSLQLANDARTSFHSHIILRRRSE